MQTKTNIGARRLIAMAIFAVFMIASIPMSMVSAKQIDVLVTETIDNSVVDQVAETGNNIIAEAPQAPVTAQEAVVQEPNTDTEPVRADHSRPERVQNAAEVSQDQPVNDHVHATPAAPEVRPDNVRAEKPAARTTEKNPVQALPAAIAPILPEAIPMPPTPTWTTISGVLTTQTWNTIDDPYFITGDVTIPAGNTLTINPGVHVGFNGSFSIFVLGAINAVGTSGNMIIFNLTAGASWNSIEFQGNGAGALSYIHFDWAVNAVQFNNANNTVEIAFCNFTNIVNYGIWVHGASRCGTNIHDNTFSTTDYAYYEDILFTNTKSITIPNRVFSYNNVTSTWGYFSTNLEFNTPNPGANIIFGQTTITWNKLPNLRINNYYVYDMMYGMITWGDVIITDNTIVNTVATFGLYFYGDLDELTDITANIGDVSILRNDVTSNDYGINIDYWDVTNLYGTSAVYLQTCQVNDNTVNTSGGQDAIYVYYDAMGEMYDYSYINSPGAEMNRNTVIDSGSEGIFMDFEPGYDMYNYASIEIGDIVIDDNTVLDASGYGIYQYAYEVGYDMYDNSRFVMGDIITTNNNVTSDDDALELYLYEMGRYMYQNAYASFGDVYTWNNEFNSSGNDGGYIYVDYMGSYMYGNAQAWFGNFECTYNDFISTGGTNALNIEDIEDIGYELYGNAQVHYGDITISWNNIGGWHHGFYFNWYGYVGYYIYENSFCEVGDFEVNHNTIIAARNVASNDAYGFWFASDYVGYEMWGASKVVIGHMEFNDNDVTILHGVDSDGMYFSYIYEYAAYMYGTASFTMTGNLEVCRNTVNATVGYYGIYTSFYDMAYYLYGKNNVEFQDFLLNDNDVWANDYGMYAYLDYLAYYIYGDCNVSFGDLELNGNTVWSGGSYGIYSEWEYLASELYGDQVNVDFGDFRQNDNIINATFGVGAYGWWCELMYWAYDVYEGTDIVHFGNYEFMRNTINSTGDAVYFDWEEMAAETYGSCELYFGDFTVSENHVNSTGDSGIYWTNYLYCFAYDVYDESFVVFGDFYCQNNDVVSNDYGIYGYSSYTLGDYLEDHSISRLGDIIWTGNTVNNSGLNAGIYFYMYYCLSDNADTAQGYLGDVHVDNNIVSSGGSGIYFEYYYIGYDLDDETISVMGDTTINDNTIDTQWYGGDNGIYMYGLDTVGATMTENAYFEMGIVEIAGNTITSNSDGIYWYYYYEVAYELDGNTQAHFGDVLVTENNIFADNYGIYLDDWYCVGYDTDYNSLMTMGDIKFNDNTIYSDDECIYFDEIYEWGYRLYDNSIFTMGNFEICGNYFNSTDDDGIYFSSFYEFASNMEANAYFEMGEWLLNDNTIICDGYGIYFYPYEFAYDNDDSSVAIFGDNEIARNDIIATDDGIYSSWLYEFGYDMYDDSYAEFGNSFVIYNTINTTGGYGIYLDLEYFGYNVYDTSDVIAGDYTVSFNDIVSTDEGIYFYEYYVGYDLTTSSFSYAASTVTLGDIEVNDNTIYSDNDYGIYFDCEDLAYEVYDESRVTTGSIEVNNNDITGFDGIYFYYYEICYNIYDNSIATIGTVDISYNTIDVDSNNEGIYFDTDYLMDSGYGYSQSYIGDMTIHDNEILYAADGIRIDNDWSAYLNDNAYAEVGSLKVYDNTINCSNRGIHLNYYSDNNVVATATMVWHAWEIYDNTVTSENVGFDVASDGNAPVPEWDVHDNSFTGSGGTGVYGIYVDDAEFFLVQDCTFDSFDYGVTATTNTELRMASCTLTNMDTDDVYLNTNSNVFMIDCDFDKSDVTYMDGTSTLDIGWYLNVTVQTPLGNMVPFADLEAISAGAVYTENVQTNANGQAIMMLREARYNQANQYPAAPLVNFNNHNVTATKSINTGWAIPEVTMDASKAITIILGDTLPPTVAGGDYSDKFATTGDMFTMRAGASDDMGVQSVRVDYRVTGSGGWTQGAMTYDGTLWTYTTGMPTNLIGNVEYIFTATDIGGNPSLASATWTVPITDNDAPVIVDNSLPAVSPTYTFAFSASDNIALSNVQLEYWLTGNAPTVMNMGASGTYNHTIAVPYLPTSSLNYQISAVDTSGNFFIGNVISMPILDVAAPWLISDNSSKNATTGEQFNFKANVIDNYLLQQVRVIYWFGTGPQTNMTLNLTSGNYTGAITVPSNTRGPLNYYIAASDVAGNWLVTNASTVNVLDNDVPAIVSDTSDTTATTGDAFTYKVTMSDNIALANTYLIYWFDTGSAFNRTLGNSTSYTGTISVPQSVAALNYYLIVMDKAGNKITGATHIVAVTDNDAPVIGTDGSAATAAPGAIFAFNISAADNIGITSAQVIYWFGSGSPTALNLNGLHNFNQTVLTPAGLFDDLHYYFVFADAAGNSARTSEKIVNIIDTAAPALGTDGSDTSSKVGTEFEFSVGASDDGGMKYVYAVYWIDGGELQYALLMLNNGTYTGTISIPEGDSLHYYFIAEDMSGNRVQSAQKDISITPADEDITPEPETITEDLPWLYIIIIIILAVIVVVLLVTRNKGGSAPAAAAPQPAPQPPVEQAPEEIPTVEESEVLEK